MQQGCRGDDDKRRHHLLRASVKPSPIGSSTVSTRWSACTVRLKARAASVEGERSSASATDPPQSVLSIQFQSAAASQSQAVLVIGAEIFLVRIDEAKVEAVRVAVCNHRREGVERRPKAHLDAVSDAGAAPTALGDGGEGCIDLAGNDPTFGMYRARHSEGAASGEGADLQIPPRSGDLRQ